MNESGKFLVPDFLSAKRASSLRTMMLKNNLKKHQNFKYDIVFNSNDNKFYAFYYHDQDSFDLLLEKKEK
jgi:hypothetical protein